MNEAPESLLELAYQSLKENILRGIYPAGSRLPVDRLSRELSISSTPIKGALNRLVAEHLVEQVPRCGYAVVKLSMKDISEVLEIRKMFEIFAIRPAIKNQHRFPSIMRHMEELLNRFDHATDGIAFMEALELELEELNRRKAEVEKILSGEVAASSEELVEASKSYQKLKEELDLKEFRWLELAELA